MRILITALLCALSFCHSAFAQKAADKSPAGPSIEWINEPKDKDLPIPSGTSHLTFHSQLVNQDIGFCIYLPPSYNDETTQRFPVIYNLHGNGGTEFTSLDSIRLLNEGIAAGRWPRSGLGYRRCTLQMLR